MSTVVYYFTRSGTSETIAKALVESKGATLCKIEDSKHWNGLLGWIKAGYYSTKKKSVPIIYEKPKDEAEIILVTPLWAGSFPPATRAFIDEVSRERITLVVKSKGSTLKDRAGFIKVIDAVGENPKVSL